MPETLESLRASFNRSLRVEGKADRTLTLYGQSITYFSAWLVEQGLPADLGNLTRDQVLGWLDALRARGLTVSCTTAAPRVRAARDPKRVAAACSGVAVIVAMIILTSRGR